MIKIIAAVFMLIDHLGMVFFQDQIILRQIGRLSMPLFAYCIAKGFHKTSCFEKYLGRMGLFAVVSQVPFWMMLYVTNTISFSWLHFNIGFTFFGALIALYCYRNIKEAVASVKYSQFASVYQTINALGILAVMIFVTVIRCDYGAYGILLVLVFYEFYILQKNIILTPIMLFAATFVLMITSGPGQFEIQLLGIPAFLVILIVKDSPIKQFKYFFYFFYPVHMFLLSIIKWIS